MKQLIHTGVVEHMSGIDVHTATSEEGLDKLLAQYCRRNWPLKIPEPDTDAALVEAYFEDHENDSLTREISSVEIDVHAPILHTFENCFSDGHLYRQFVQFGTDPMEANSLNLSVPTTLRQFLEELHAELALDPDPEPDDYWNESIDGYRTAWNSELSDLIADGNILGFLARAEEIHMLDPQTKADHVSETHYGEWSHDTVLLDPTHIHP